MKIVNDPRYDVRHDCPTHCPYVDNLHACMNDFLDHDEDFWLSMDDDNPPLSNPLDMVDEDKDIIGFPTPVWYSAVPGDRPWYLNALRKVKDGYKPVDIVGGWQEVDAIGSGCFMVARRVMEAMKYDKPFMRQWGKDGRVTLGGDYSFCEKAKARGFKIWVHSDYICDHFNELPLKEVVERFGQMYDQIHGLD